MGAMVKAGGTPDNRVFAIGGRPDKIAHLMELVRIGEHATDELPEDDYKALLALIDLTLYLNGGDYPEDPAS